MKNNLKQSRRGSALLLTLMVVSLLLVLVLSFVVFVRIELREVTNQQNLLVARQNAKLGLNIALSQLQKYAGADQRITAPATTVYPSKDVTTGIGELYDNSTYGYRSKASTSSSIANGTFLSPTERSNWDTALKTFWNSNNRQPHYTAVFNSSLRVDMDRQKMDRQEYGDADGDGNFGESSDYNTTFGEFKRDQVPVWLVSGMEKYTVNQETGAITNSSGATVNTTAYQNDISPLASVPDPDPNDPNNDSIWVVNSPDGETGSATLAAESSDGLDGRVKVKKQPIKDPKATNPANDTIGHYAWWVGDESQKANFAVRDPYASETDKSSADYRNRLQVPQRLGWEQMTGFSAAGIDPNDPTLLKVTSTEQIPLISNSNPNPLADKPNNRGPVPRNFHNLTAYSRSLQTDTALGGLKKDLTVFLEGSGASLSSSDPILDRSRYIQNDPRFGSSNGFPNTSSTANLATWEDIENWHDASTSTTVQPGRSPVLSSYQMFFAFTVEGNKLQLHMLPMVALWNPYDTPLSNTTYNLKWRHNFVLWRMGLGTEGLIDPTPGVTTDGGIFNGTTTYVHTLTGVDWYDSGDSDYKSFGMGGTNGISAGGTPFSGANLSYRFSPFDRGSSQPEPSDSGATWVTYEFSADFEPGQVKIFSVGSSQQISDPSDLHTGSAKVTLTNVFDTDFPSSYYFDIAEIGAPVPTSDDLANNRVKFYGEMLSGSTNTPGFMSMELLKGSSTQLWRSEFLGSPGNWGVHLSLQYTPLARSMDTPSTWQTLLDRTDWESTAKGGSTGATRDEPLIAMYRGKLEPFTPYHNSQYKDGRMQQAGVNRYQRAFATFNLAAPNTDLHLNIEGSRSNDTVNNTDKFNVNRLYNADFSGGTNNTRFMGWSSDGNGAYNQSQDIGSDTEGFSLLTWRSYDASTKRVKGLSRLPLRQASRASANILSLGQLQQVNLSKLAWQPSFPLANSEATPYVDRARVAGIESYQVGSGNNTGSAKHTSYYRPPGIIPNDNQNRMLDVSYLLNENLWDSYFLSSIPQSGSFTTYDLGSNSTGTSSTPRSDVLLPNSRHRLINTDEISASEIRDFDTAAAYVDNVGALNVNSTSVDAWKALLTAFRGLAYDNDSEDRSTSDINASVPVSRTIDPLSTSLGGGNLEFTDSSKDDIDIGATEVSGGGRDYSKFFTGYRYLTDEMIQNLAERIVDEVRLRGPFYSLADFVNRRLVAPDGAYTNNSVWRDARTNNKSSNSIPAAHSYGVTSSFGSGSDLDADYDSFVGLQGINGTLQRAINLSGINGGVNYPLPIDYNDRSFRVDLDPSNLSDGASGNQPMSMYPNTAHYLDTEHLAGAPTGEVGQLLSHTPGFVTQGDLLAMLGPALTPRGDTFLIRTYGDSINPSSGEFNGRAWLEAVVQRVAEPVTPAGNTGIDQFRPADPFGRKFKIISFRWLSEAEL